MIGVLALADTYRSARATADEVLDRALAGSILAIAERVVINAENELEVDVPYIALEMLISAAQDRVFYKVEGPPGTFITGYRDLPGAATENGPPISGRPSFSNAEFRGEPIRLAALTGAASSSERSVAFRVTVAETTTARQKVAREILIRTAARHALLIAIAGLAVWFGIKRALTPLDRLEGAIGRRNPNDLHAIEHAVPREVSRLVQSINGLMARLASALEARRHFTGNASHQLRTPLAVVRTQIELSRRAKSEDSARAALATADDALGHMERTLTQLLVLAQIDEVSGQPPPVRKAVDLIEIARETSASYVTLAGKAGIDLGFDAIDGPVSAPVDPILIAELLGNLIENIIAHAGRGAIATVRVTRAARGAPCLEVEDTGPGIEPARREDAIRRFVRLSKGTTGSAGLGLAIVTEIAGLFGATMTLNAGSQGHGLLVRVVFPVAD